MNEQQRQQLKPSHFPLAPLKTKKKKKKKVVHFFFVPPLMLTLAVLLEAHLPPLSGLLSKAGLGASAGGRKTSLLPFLPEPLASLSLLNWPFLVLSLYAVYYSFLDLFAGISWAAFLALPMWLAATAWAGGSSSSSSTLFGGLSPARSAGLVHFFSWLVQVGVGHAAIEGRRPALVDSFFQSVVLAGLFAWFELLFLAGYRPRLKREIDRRVAADAERRALLVQAAASSGSGGPRVTRSRSGISGRKKA